MADPFLAHFTVGASSTFGGVRLIISCGIICQSASLEIQDCDDESEAA